MLLVTLVPQIGVTQRTSSSWREREQEEGFKNFLFSFFAATDFESKEHSLAGLDLNSTQDFVVSLILIFDMRSHGSMIIFHKNGFMVSFF